MRKNFNAQKYNEKMDKLFESAIEAKRKYCSHEKSRYMGEIPCTGRLICDNCGEQLN